MPVSMTSLVFLVGLLAAATYFDLRYHRIPNALTLGGALAGLVLVLQTNAGWGMLALSLGGAICGVLLFLPLYAFGKMGAGDVKMLAMVGVFVGPIGVFWTAMYSLIAGGVLALVWLVGAWGFREMALRTLGTVTLTRLGGPVRHSDGSGDAGAGTGASALKSKMPYAAAIAVGAVFAARTQLT